MESIVIGTAGHIDHGKTALVKALTGQNTDNLAEERRRGITINLGFAYFQLPSGKTAGIVDVPGHERLIKNMLAGAGGIDIAMVIIAADDGVMPQTREHINILQYLDIQESLVVITKTGLVDDDYRELMLEETKKYLATTFLRESAIFQVDSLSGQGLVELVKELDILANRIGKPKLNQPARLNVDRVFTLKGFGTIVTGTLNEGVISLDDEIVLYPQGLTSKVRSLQVHEQGVSSSSAGQRTAINLANIAAGQVHRGDVIAQKGSVFVTRVIDVQLSLLEESKLKIKRLDPVKIYLGAKETVANIVPLDGKIIQPGQKTYAQIILKEEIVVRRSDRFVLRSITPVSTMGGGIILDPLPQPYKKISGDILAGVIAKDSPDICMLLKEFVKAHPFINRQELQLLVNEPFPPSKLEQLAADGDLIAVEGRYFHPGFLEEVRREITAILETYHQDLPLQRGIPKMELFSQQRLTQELKQFYLLLDFLSGTQVIKENQGEISLYAFTPSYTPQQLALKQEMEEQVLSCGYAPPAPRELTGDAKERKLLLEALLESSFILLGGQAVLDRRLYQEAKEIAERLMQEFGAIKLSDFRDAICTSRKYALLILEQFDKEQFTKRAGENRVLFRK